MKNLFLDKPCMKYQKSFERYALAYKKSGENHYFDMYKKALENIDEYINDLDNYSKGINLPEWMPATSTFWLIDNGEVVGVTRVRHKEWGTAGHIGYDISPCCRKRGYGTQILKLALAEAKKLGINEAIVTCNIDNTSSKRIIEKYKGKLLGTIFDEEENEYLYKYSVAAVSNNEM